MLSYLDLFYEPIELEIQYQKSINIFSSKILNKIILDFKDYYKFTSNNKDIKVGFIEIGKKVRMEIKYFDFDINLLLLKEKYDEKKNQ